MKRFFWVAAAAVITLVYPLYFSSAEGGKISFEELSTQWEENAYPDDVGGVYWDSNKFVITLVHPSDARKQEILSGLSDPGSVAFKEAAYSHHQLLSVQKEIAAQMNEGSGIYAVGISDSDNRVEVTVDKKEYDQYTERFQTAYGGMVTVKIGTAAVAIPEKRHYFPIFCAAAVLALGTASFLFYKKRKKRTES